MDLGLEGKVFVVTAGSRGLGRATADALVADGARVVVVARDQGKLDEAVAELGEGSAVGLAADLDDPATGERAARVALDTWGRLDGALVSVGGPPRGTALGTDDETWRSAFDSVVVSALRVVRAVVGAAEQPVALALVLSTSAKEPLAGMAPSNVTRPGLAMLVTQLADELGPAGSRVVGLLPGTVHTDRISVMTSHAPDPDAELARLGSTCALGRVGRPEELGRVAAFVLSDAASYLTGAMVAVDGGRLRGL